MQFAEENNKCIRLFNLFVRCCPADLVRMPDEILDPELAESFFSCDTDFFTVILSSVTNYVSFSCIPCLGRPCHEHEDDRGLEEGSVEGAQGQRSVRIIDVAHAGGIVLL